MSTKVLNYYHKKYILLSAKFVLFPLWFSVLVKRAGTGFEFAKLWHNSIIPKAVVFKSHYFVAIKIYPWKWDLKQPNSCHMKDILLSAKFGLFYFCFCVSVKWTGNCFEFTKFRCNPIISIVGLSMSKYLVAIKLCPQKWDLKQPNSWHIKYILLSPKFWFFFFFCFCVLVKWTGNSFEYAKLWHNSIIPIAVVLMSNYFVAIKICPCKWDLKQPNSCHKKDILLSAKFGLFYFCDLCVGKVDRTWFSVYRAHENGTYSSQSLAIQRTFYYQPNLGCFTFVFVCR